MEILRIGPFETVERRGVGGGLFPHGFADFSAQPPVYHHARIVVREVGRVGGYLLRRVAKLCGRIGIAHDGSQIVADIGAALPRRGRNPHFQRRGPEYDRVVGDRLVDRAVVSDADVRAAFAPLVAQHGHGRLRCERRVCRRQLLQPCEAAGAVRPGEVFEVVFVAGQFGRLVMVRADEVFAAAFVQGGLAGRLLDDCGPSVARRCDEQRFADEGVAAAGDFEGFADRGRMLQDFAREDRNRGRRRERNGTFGGVDRHGQPLVVHARQYADHPGPADADERVPGLRTAEGDDFVAGEVVAHVEVEIAADHQLPVGAHAAPCRERTAPDEHVLAHGVPDVVRRMVVELTLVRGAYGVEVVRAVERPGVYLAPVLFGDVPSQIAVEDHDQAPQELQVTVRRDEFADLVHENLLLIAHQPGRERSSRRSRLFGRPGRVKLPETVSVMAQETSAARGVAAVVRDAVGRRVYGHRGRLHVGREVESPEERRRQQRKRKERDERVFEKSFHASPIFLARYSVPSSSAQVAAAESVTPIAP